MCTAANGKQYPVGAPECQPTMSCDQLVISNKGNDSTSLNYSFVIKASATNTTISTYSVDFGDGTPAYTGATPSIDHAYAKAGSYNIVASIMVAGQSKAITADACKGSITITPPMCTAANGKQYPVGAPECTTVPPVLPPTTPGTPLPNTGPGETIGLFTGFAIAGAAAHRIMASRRMFGLGLSR